MNKITKYGLSLVVSLTGGYIASLNSQMAFLIGGLTLYLVLMIVHGKNFISLCE